MSGLEFAREFARFRGADHGRQNPTLQGAAVLAARLLRRRGARHRIGRAGARDLRRRRSMCATRSSTTATWSRACAPRARFSSRSSTRFPRPSAPVDFLRPWRAACGSGGGGAAQSVRARRHLSAGHQGASRGRDPSPARARDRADRPRRPSGSDRHHGPIAGRRGHAGRDARRRRQLRAARRRQARLRDADHAVGRRHRGDRRARSSSAFRRSSVRTRKTSATPPPTGRKRSSASRRWSTP